MIIEIVKPKIPPVINFAKYVISDDKSKKPKPPLKNGNLCKIKGTIASCPPLAEPIRPEL